MKKGILILLSWSLPFLLIAQSNTSTQSMVTKEGPGAAEGIHWTTGLSWEQIKQKAKRENKYIFIDAYATWCGPCKMMDKYVYPNDTVGDFFNEHFIPVKVQMDVTDNDNQSIRAWYNDANTIKKECMVTSYPTFIFFSPDGKIVQKESRYFSVQEFVAIGKEALTHGKTYDDPYPAHKRLVDNYKGFVDDYKQGIKRYDLISNMIKIAGELGDTAFSRQLFIEHLEYASGLNEDERYTKENIELWSSFVLKLDSKALQFFLKDHDIIDQVMGRKGWSIGQVNKTIQHRIVDSFFKMQKGMTTSFTGEKNPNSEIMFTFVPIRNDGKIRPDLVEADWKTLKKMIRKYFRKDYVGINVYYAKSRWYDKHQNEVAYTRNYFDWKDKNPPTDLAQESPLMNQIAWETFLYVNDDKLLKRALEWMAKIVEQEKVDYRFLDTYANLLYKLGHTAEAIEWEEKAMKLNPDPQDQSYSKVLQQMKKGEPTYQDKGAIWLK
jgi:thioredoxin-related protein